MPISSNVIANGPRKAGTHAALRMLSLMGFEVRKNFHIQENALHSHKRKQIIRIISKFNNVAMHGHIPYDKKLSDVEFVTILRHPRNMVVSYARYFGSLGHFGRLCNHFPDFEDRMVLACHLMKTEQAGIHRELSKYTGWLSHPNTIKFEELIEGDRSKIVSRLAKNLGKKVDSEKVSSKIVGATTTYTGELSTWQDHWTDRVETAYRSVGGHKIESEWGYESSFHRQA